MADYPKAVSPCCQADILYRDITVCETPLRTVDGTPTFPYDATSLELDPLYRLYEQERRVDDDYEVVCATCQSDIPLDTSS